MAGLADFLDSLLRGILLVSLAVTLGGTAWGLWGLRGWRAGATPSRLAHRCVVLLGASALVVAVIQVALLGLRMRELTGSLGTSVVEDFLVTTQFAAGASRAVLALAVAAAAGWIVRRPGRTASWMVLAVLSALLAATGGWLSHAWGRLEQRGFLMGLTILHQLGALVWAGALVHLGSTWPVTRQDSAVESVWPELVWRFSRLAIVAVLLLLLSVTPLVWIYGGGIGNLIGTGFGSLILVKCVLLAAALLLAAFNFVSARAAGRPALALSLRLRLPYLVEAEAILLGMALFAAVALSAQPPAADLPVGDRATIREVGEVFRPKLPGLRTPSLEAVHRTHSQVASDERSPDAYLWSNFSHNVAGLILLPTSVLALLGAAARTRWARHWPLGFLPLAVFVYLRAAANDRIWPFGPFGLAGQDAETMQHLLAALLVLALGLFEWWARAPGRRRAIWGYVFPTLAMAGGVLLLTHSHTAFETKPAFLVQVTHTMIGALAGLLAAGRWLELRLPPPGGRVAGAVAGMAMLGIALVLVFYREANVVIAD